MREKTNCGGEAQKHTCTNNTDKETVGSRSADMDSVRGLLVLLQDVITLTLKYIYI